MNLLDRIIGGVMRAAQWLVLPVSLLLIAQWPLREVVHLWSREANDLAQWLFALYAGLAVTLATRRKAHLAAAMLAHRYSPALRQRIARAAALVCLVPWAGFVVVMGAGPVWRSVIGLEAFPETYNPGYFLVKAAAWLMALAILAQALADAFRREAR